MESSKSAELKKFIKTKLDCIMQPLGEMLKEHKPQNLVEFTYNWVRETHGYRATVNENERLELHYLRSQVPKLEKNLTEGSSQNIPQLREHFGRFHSIDIIEESDSDSSITSDEDEGFVLEDIDLLTPKSLQQVLTEESEASSSRFSISGEVYGRYNKRSSFKPEFIHKTPSVSQRLKNMLKKHWIFSKLEEEDICILVDAMKQQSYHKGDKVIAQGETGSVLYIVDSGTFDCIDESSPVTDVGPARLKEYTEGEVFGELALIYNCPRTASIIANEDSCKVFTLDRLTFNFVLQDNNIKRNESYLKMLANVPILKTMDLYEKAKILDACTHVEFSAGEYVIIEGEPGEEFFILLKGEAYATKLTDSNPDPVVVKEYTAGDYFGERALIKNATRAVNIVAKTDIKCLSLGRENFNNLLGPIEHILKRNMEIYINYIS